MRRILGSAQLVFVVFFLGCTNGSVGRLPEVATASPAAGDRLDRQQLVAKQVKGAQGDADSAMDVAAHYAAATGEDKEARYWLTIAAENESPLAIHLLSGEFFRAGGRVNCERALYWLGRLALHKEYVLGHPAPNFLDNEVHEIRTSTERCR